MSEYAPPQPATGVERYPTEIPLLILVVMASIAIWIMLAVSLVGLFYGVFFAVFFFLAHVAFIAYLRGSAVKLGPEQMPELYSRVQLIASRLGLAPVPDAYVMQAGGALNALATKLFGTNFIVLYAELLDACGDDAAAADFIIAHEIGHLKAGHLRFQWVIAPARLVPFLGSAYSRAREYTADRYGAAGVNDAGASTRGLVVLAAGGEFSRRVNVDAMLRQRHDLTSVLMTIGRWMSTHPPLVDRIAELDRVRAPERVVAPRGILGAIALIVFAFVVPLAVGGHFLNKFMKKVQEQVAAQQTTPQARPERPAPQRPKVVVEDVPAAIARAQKDMRELASVADKYRAQTGRYPENTDALYALWRLDNPRAVELIDPFDGKRYAYELGDGEYDIWSAGEEQPGMADRMHVTSGEAAPPAASSARN